MNEMEGGSQDKKEGVQGSSTTVKSLRRLPRSVVLGHKASAAGDARDAQWMDPGRRRGVSTGTPSACRSAGEARTRTGVCGGDRHVSRAGVEGRAVAPALVGAASALLLVAELAAGLPPAFVALYRRPRRGCSEGEEGVRALSVWEN